MPPTASISVDSESPPAAVPNVRRSVRVSRKSAKPSIESATVTGRDRRRNKTGKSNAQKSSIGNENSAQTPNARSPTPALTNASDLHLLSPSLEFVGPHHMQTRYIKQRKKSICPNRSMVIAQRNITTRTKPKKRIENNDDLLAKAAQSIAIKECVVLLSDVMRENVKEAPLPHTRRSRTFEATASLDMEGSLSSPLNGRSKRKHTTTKTTTVDSVVSPPKKSSIGDASDVELTEATKLPSETKQNSIVATDKLTRMKGKNPFNIITISVKRVAASLTEKELQTLQHPTNSVRESETSYSAVETDTLTKNRSTIASKSSVSSETDLEPKRSTVNSVTTDDETSHRDNQPALAKVTKPFDSSRKTAARRVKFGKVPTLPLVEEDENEHDVYDFLNSSQIGQADDTTNGTKSGTSRMKQTKKKKEKSAKPSRKKPDVTRLQKKKQPNPLGTNARQIAQLVKKIGGGPVKAHPEPVGYVVNLHLTESPQEVVIPSSPVRQADPVSTVFLQPSSPKRALNPAVERLRHSSTAQLATSTPITGDINCLETTSNISQANDGSPWRMQDQDIVPLRSVHVSRNRDLLRSYENGTTTSPVRHVTERRKTNRQQSTGEKASLASPAQDLEDRGEPLSLYIAEVERVHSELKAISAMSERLIGVMRRYENNTDGRNISEARQKLRKWYTRSMQSFNRSKNIVNRIISCPSPLSHEQQKTVETFNQSTDKFHSMLEELRDATNHSNGENMSPPGQALPVGTADAVSKTSKAPADVIELPERGHITVRNPLKQLNFLPLPQTNSPLLSPLAKTHNTPKTPLRRELQFETPPFSEGTRPSEKHVMENDENDASVMDDHHDASDPPEPIDAIPLATLPTLAGIVHSPAKDSISNLFGFSDDSFDQRSIATPESRALNVSIKTLKKRLNNIKQLLPEQRITQRRRAAVVKPHGPTRFPSVGTLRVFASPAKRPQTLIGFAASTPRIAVEETSIDDRSEAQVSLPIPMDKLSETLKNRLNDMAQQPGSPGSPFFRQRPLERPLNRKAFRSPGKCPAASSTLQTSTPRPPEAGEPKPSSSRDAAVPAAASDDHEPPNVSAIEANEAQAEAENNRNNETPSVVLFEAPDDGFDRSTLQRTYTRIPRRRRAKNIYLANLGLDDDDDDSEAEQWCGVSSDSEAETKGRKKKGQRKQQRKPRKKKPVEETEEFKTFVQEFNSMCEDVERFEVIIE
ncbi:uncharacterized protein LOC131209436 isoform X2 [Anopheles bellator]|uniref:uncharacterized protein LOC131209436 isoform X2 n=1 Tax=Anopheles bellator TaxID=139047 RepID=UPI0026486E8C|nr:uncharacterized protein LOC131209436 isoform X2 [Anopheles bellator]